MGFPIRSNIFDERTHEHKYFSSFPVQVAVLFSPNDEEFVQSFKEMFAELDKITGDEVIFFAVLDPPCEWLKQAKERFVWRRYWENIKPTGFSLNSLMLVREIARLFGVSWHSLPVIVVSTDIWAKDHIIIATSPKDIKTQLENISLIVQKYRNPEITTIKKMLEENYGYRLIHHLSRTKLRSRLKKMYEVLSTASDEFDSYKFYSLINNELKMIQKEFSKLRNKKLFNDSNVEIDFDDLYNISEYETDALIEDVASRLIAPTAVAQKVYQHLFDQMPEFPDKLEEDSKIMLETSIKIGTMLESVFDSYSVEMPIRSANDFSNKVLNIDYTAGAQGVWKTYELEINLSIIQAARKARTIKMPDYFALYSAATPAKLNKVRTLKDDGSLGKNVNINQRDNTDIFGNKHRYLTLGDAWHVTKTLKNNSEEFFNDEIANCLGRPLDNEFLCLWEEVNNIRNSGSHIRPLRYNEYEAVLKNVLSPTTIEVLTTIKEQLRDVRN